MPKIKTRKSKFTPGEFLLKVRNSKTGKGLFALEDIPKNSCIIEYFGKPVPLSEQKTKVGRYLFETGRGLMIDGNIKENTARFINHSCVPNCEADGPRGKVYIFSKKKIKAGEELTYDYGEEYFDEFLKGGICVCPKCKKKYGKN